MKLYDRDEDDDAPISGYCPVCRRERPRGPGTFDNFGCSEIEADDEDRQRINETGRYGLECNQCGALCEVLPTECPNCGHEFCEGERDLLCEVCEGPCCSLCSEEAVGCEIACDNCLDSGRARPYDDDTERTAT